MASGAADGMGESSSHSWHCSNEYRMSSGASTASTRVYPAQPNGSGCRTARYKAE